MVFAVRGSLGVGCRPRNFYRGSESSILTIPARVMPRTGGAFRKSVWIGSAVTDEIRRTLQAWSTGAVRTGIGRPNPLPVA